MAKLFLGLDSSTQSLSAVVIDYDRRKVVCEKSLNFDQALPQYATRNGVLPNSDPSSAAALLRRAGPLIKHSSPLMADVVNCRVERIEISKSVALGAALRAAHGWLIQAGEKPKWEKVVAGFTDPVPNSEIRPNPKAARIYDQLIEKYARCEREVLKSI